MSTEKQYRYLFGPVPSRRLGRSLGVDLSPHKTCTLDCVFCQLGAGYAPSAVPCEPIPVQAVLDELADWIREDGRADWITLSGSGEPTLHARFGEIIAFARQASNLPVALLSNGTLFFRPEVRQAASRANLVKLSLSAWDRASFQAVNRPHPDMDFDAIVAGYRTFRALFTGTLWLEVFLVPGLNARPEDVAKIAALARAVQPDKIQLNTAVRPPAETFVHPLPLPNMQALAALFDPPAEIIADYRSQPGAARAVDGHAILALLRRHPATAKDIAAMTDRPSDEIAPILQALLDSGQARLDMNDTQAGHYRATRSDERR